MRGQTRQTDRQRAIPVVDGGVGDDGHVGGELAPEPEDGQKNKHLSCCRSKSKSSPDENTDVNNVGVSFFFASQHLQPESDQFSAIKSGKSRRVP